PLAPDPEPEPGRDPRRDPRPTLGLRRGRRDAHGRRPHPGAPPQARGRAHRNRGRSRIPLSRSGASEVGSAPAVRRPACMRLRARFTVLFAALAALAGIFLVAVSDATLRRAVHDRVAERFRRELEHLTADLARTPSDPEALDAFLRKAAADLECRITDIAPDGHVRHDTDLLPADVPGMQNHANRPAVQEALARGT